MKVCVLQPDYSTSDVDYKDYDPVRNLSAWLPGEEVDHVLLNKLTVYKQLKALKKQHYDVFVNLCEGYLEWSVPSIDVIHSLELLNLPYTGPNACLYDPPKELMKYVAYAEGVATPDYVLVDFETDVKYAVAQLKFPLFVKPAKAGDSLGIDENALVNDVYFLEERVKFLLEEYDEILVEEYIEGREFSVLVAAVDGIKCKVYEPVEYVFPEAAKFKTYAMKTSDLHPGNNVLCTDERIAACLKDASEKIFRSFGGVGYARLDFRINEKGELFFLEINFTCSVFYADGYEGSADYILKYDKDGHAGFLRNIIAEGIERHIIKQKAYHLKGNSIDGYGIFASRKIEQGEVVFKGEGKEQRIITRSHVNENWSEKEKEVFRRYAVPLSSEVFILWAENPAQWAPQNHSCNANTRYKGLDVVASRVILAGDELTLDYETFLNEGMEPFTCNCRANNCRKYIKGIKGNTVTSRETTG